MDVADREGLVACFDETAAAVFATACRLSAGNLEQALDLTVATYGYLGRMADASAATGGVQADRRWLVAAAHSVCAADDASPSRQPRAGPVAALSPVQRVALSLDTIEGWERADIAGLLDVDVETVDGLIVSALRQLGTVPADAALRAGEIWFDDVMRSDVRAAIVGGTPRVRRSGDRLRPMPTAASATAAAIGSGGGARSRIALEPPPLAFERPGRTRPTQRATIATLVALVAVLSALALWVRPSGDDRREQSEPTDARAPSTTDATAATDPTAGAVASAGAQQGTGAEATGGIDTGRPPETTTPFTVDPSGAAGIPAASTTPPLTGYIVESLPTGFQAGGGYADGRDTARRRNWYELWASADAGRTQGRWFAVVVVDDDLASPDTDPSVGASRVDIGGHPGLMRTAEDGVQTLEVRLDGRQHIELRAFGFTTDEFTALATSIDVGDANRPSYSPAVSDLFVGLEVRASEPTNQPSLALQPFNRLETTAFYVSANGNQTITVNTGPQGPSDLLGSRLLYPGPTGPAAAFVRDGLVDLGGIPRVTGSISDLDEQPFAFVQWHDAGLTITVLGNVDAAQLFEVARTTRHASSDEWTAQLRAVPVFTPGRG